MANTLSFLDLEHLERSTDNVEWHPLRPFLPEGMKVLFLGSFPPQRKRWCIDFFYPNFQNDHWRIEGLIFFGNKNHFVDEKEKRYKLPEIVRFLEEKGIGFYDTATAIRRLKGNASDDALEVVVPTDIPDLLHDSPQCRAIVTTGEKATRTICQSLGMKDVPKPGQYVRIPQESIKAKAATTNSPLAVSSASCPPLVLYRLPSSSRAYPMALEKKAEAYRKMFELAGLV